MRLLHDQTGAKATLSHSSVHAVQSDGLDVVDEPANYNRRGLVEAISQSVRNGRKRPEADGRHRACQGAHYKPNRRDILTQANISRTKAIVLGGPISLDGGMVVAPGNTRRVQVQKRRRATLTIWTRPCHDFAATGGHLRLHKKGICRPPRLCGFVFWSLMIPC